MTENNDRPTERLGTPALNRRRLLKVAVATAPVIATLPSGAALARSSNLIGPTSGAGTDALGRTQCLDVRSGTVVDGMVDLGVPPSGRVTAITERYYRDGATGASTPISERDMCNRGGEFYYQSTGWRSVTVPRGIVVSATALSSFAGSIYTTEI
jgi:hypothetical protein